MDPIRGSIAALTSNSEANLRKVEPACSFDSWIPSLLHRQALYYDSDAGEQCDENGSRKEPPNEPNLDLISHNSKKEDANGTFANTDYHKTSHLAKHFVLDSCEVDGWITDLCVQSS